MEAGKPGVEAMKIKRKKKYEEISFDEFLSKFGGEVVIEEDNRETDNFTATIPGCFVKQGDVFKGWNLKPVAGFGLSEQDAIVALVSEINNYSVFIDNKEVCASNVVLLDRLAIIDALKAAE
jgi:hypothetical protein